MTIVASGASFWTSAITISTERGVEVVGDLVVVGRRRDDHVVRAGVGLGRVGRERDVEVLLGEEALDVVVVDRAVPSRAGSRCAPRRGRRRRPGGAGRGAPPSTTRRTRVRRRRSWWWWLRWSPGELCPSQAPSAAAVRRTISVSRSRRGGDVEPHVPGQARVVVVAGRQPDPPFSSSTAAGSVVAVGAQVEPGEVRRLERPHPRLRAGARPAARRAGSAAGRAARRSAASHGSPCVYAATAATTPSVDHESLRAIGTSRQPVAGRVVAGHDLGALEAGGVERLGRGDHGDRVVGGARERRGRGRARAPGSTSGAWISSLITRAPCAVDHVADRPRARRG